MHELNFPFNTYYQDGKPEAVKPVEINYTTNAGRGTIKMDMVRVFPCTVHDVKTIIDTLWMSADPYEIAGTICDYIKSVIADLQSLRSADAYSYTEKQYNTKFTGFIKKYLANLEKIAGAFGLETVADEKAECAKMHKCEVHTIHFEDGKKVIKTFDGKYFVKNCVKYKVYKACKARYEIIVAGTGISIAYCNKLETAPEFIDEQKERAIANIKKDNGFEKVHADFVALCDAHGITAPELSPVLLNNQEPETTPAENTPAPALDAKSETSEARPAADQETRTAEKPARNVLKPGCVRIICTQLRDTKTNKAGDRFEVLKDEYGQWLGDNLRTKKNYAFTESGLCDPELLKIEIQQTADEIKKSLCIIDKPRTATRRDQVPQKPAQVWKPCTMSPLRKYGIIYHTIIGATDRQKPASADRLKAVLRLPKMQRCINLGATDKNPVTGTTQRQDGIQNKPIYAHGKPPGTEAQHGFSAIKAKCHTADRRKIKQKSPPEFFKQGVEFTQSSHFKMTENGTRIFQGGAGYQKFCTENMRKKFFKKI